MRTLFPALLAVLTTASGMGGAQTADAGRHDPQAVFNTRVPFLKPLLSKPSTATAFSGAQVMEVAPATAFGGSRYSVGQTVTATTTAPEAEEHITMDPLNPNFLVAAISDFSLRGGFNTTKVSYSLANGASGTWEDYFVPLNSQGYPVTADGRVWQANSDPVVAMDREGNIYLSDLYLNGDNNANGLYVAVGNITAGEHMSRDQVHAVKTNPNPNTTSVEDKPWIAVDNTGQVTSGNVYESWTHFVLDGNGNVVRDYILFSRSTSHAQSWATPIRLSTASQDGAVQGAQVAVAPTGTVYVVYEVFYVNGARRQFLTRSTNGGLTFSAPVAITPFFHDVNFQSDYRTNSFPSLAINPNNGYVYVSYAKQPASSLGAQVEFVRSQAPGSLLFTAPQMLNDTPAGVHFFPAIAVDASAGSINVGWFDTRNSPDNTDHYSIYATRSLNNGATWAPNTRVSGSYYSGKNSFIGDYMGMVAGGGSVHPVWTSGGFNNGKLKTATLH